MSILNLSSLSKIFNASSKKRSGKKSISEKLNRKLALDSLEARVLLSVTPNTVSEIIVNTEYSTNQTTYTNGNAVAIDDDGDYVATWTRGDNIYKDTTYGNVGWYTEEGELVFYTDRNYIDGNYTDDKGETHDVTLVAYNDPYANTTLETYYVDQDGNEGWTDNWGNFHAYTAENFQVRRYTIYNGYNVVYENGDSAPQSGYQVRYGQYYETGENTPDGQREIVQLIGRLYQRTRTVSRQLVDYNVYGRYFTDEVQRLTVDTSNVSNSNMLYKAEVQVGEWYAQKITFAKSYGSEDPLEGNCEISYTYPTTDGETSPVTDPVTFYFSENNNGIDNAKSMQEALVNIFGEGNVRVTAETLLSYKVEFKIANKDENVDFIDYQNPLLVSFANDDAAFGASVELVSFPNSYEFFFEYEKVYESNGNWSGEYKKDENGRYIIDASATAEQIAVAFEYGPNSTSRKASPIDTGAPTDGIQTNMYPCYEVSVVPVYGLNDEGTLIGFDITFVNGSGKQNIEELRVLNVYTVSEDYFADEYADYITDNPDLLTEIQESGNVASVVTLKESSQEFRVNPTSDEVFNRKSKIFRNTDQYESSVAMDDNGDFGFVWTSTTLQTYIQGSFTDIYTRLYSASMVNAYDGVQKTYVEVNDGKAFKPVTGSMKVNTETANPQQSPSIAMDDQGNVFIVWAETAQTLSFENGIFLQCLDYKGNKIDLKYLGVTEGLTADGLAVRVEPEVTGHAVMPQVAVSPDGKTVAVSWNWTDPNQPERSEIRMCVYTFNTDANNKTTLQKSAITQVDTVEGLEAGDRSATDNKHLPTGISYSYDNKTSIQINKENQIGIAWTGAGTDEMGFDTVDTYFSQYQANNGNLTALRTKYRINSANMNSGTATTWSWYHHNPTVAMDADGDFLVSYDGAGMDISDGVTLRGDIIEMLQAKINLLSNSDLLKYINWNYIQFEVTTLTGDQTVPVETAIQDICAHALNGQFNDPDTFMYEWYPSYDGDGNPANGYYDNSRTYRVVTEDGKVVEGYRMAEATDNGIAHLDYNYDDRVNVTADSGIHHVYNGMMVQVLNDANEIVTLQRVATAADRYGEVTYTEYRKLDDDPQGPAVARVNGADRYVRVLDGDTERDYLQVIYPKTVVTKVKEKGADGKEVEQEVTTYDYTFTENLDPDRIVEINTGTVTVEGYQTENGQTVMCTVLSNGFVVERVRVASPDDTDKNFGHNYSDRVRFVDDASGVAYYGYRDADGNPVTVLVVGDDGTPQELPLVATASDRAFHPNYDYGDHTDEIIGTTYDEDGNLVFLYGYEDVNGNPVNMTIMSVYEDAAGQLVYEEVTGRRVADPDLDDPTSPDYVADYDFNMEDATARYAGCTMEQYSRLYAILHSVLDMTKGEGSGVMFSSFDASPIGASTQTVASDPTITSADQIVNTMRDGQDGKFYIKFDRTNYFSNGRSINGLSYATKYLRDEDGNYVLDDNGLLIDKEAVNEDDFETYSSYEILYNQLQITLGAGAGRPDYGVLNTNVTTTTDPITVTLDMGQFYVGTGFNSDAFIIELEKAITDALPNLWEDNLQDGYPTNFPFKGAVKVRAISTDDARLLDETPYDISNPLFDTYQTFCADKYVFEVQFQGPLHDAGMMVQFAFQGSDDLAAGFISRPCMMVDLNNVEGYYARFVVDGELNENVILDLRGATTIEQKYGAFQRALQNAGGAYSYEVVDMVCDSFNSPYNYGEVYKVLVIKHRGGIDAEEITFNLSFNNPDAGNNNNNNNNQTPQYPDWNENTLKNYDIVRPGWGYGGNGQFDSTTYSNGSAGTSQAFSNVGMTPEGDFAFVWTQYNQNSDGDTSSESIYTRTYNEIYDTYGPRVSDIYYSNSAGIQKILEGYTVEDLSTSDETSAIIVTFTEDMMDYLKVTSAIDPREMDFIETHSVTNPANWVLMKDGLIINNAIKEIYFGMNASADPYIQNMGTITALRENKWEAVVVLNEDVDLSTGNYQLQLSQVVQDANGNYLNSDGIDTEGGNTTVNFDLLTGAQDVVDETPDDEYEGDQVFVDVDNSEDLWSPTALASDPEGDSVLVWTSDEAGKEGVYAKVRYLKWDEALSENREECALDEGSIVVQVTDDASAFAASVDMSGDGNFVVTWTANANDGYKKTYVYARVFDLNGNAITDAFVVSQTQAESKWSQVAVSEYGDFVITWQTFNKTTGWDIFAQRFDETGKILGAVDEIQHLNFSRDFSGSFQIVVTDPNTYEEYTTDWIQFQKTFTTYRDIQRALDDLEIPGLTFKVSAKSRTQISVTIICDNSIVDPNIDLMEILTSKDSKGSAAVSESLNGSRSPFQVNETEDGNQMYAAIDMDYKGNFVISWTSSSPDATDAWDTDIYARQFSSNEEIGLMNGTIKAEDGTTLGKVTEKITWMDGEEEPLSTQSGVAMISVLADAQTGMGWSGSGVLLSDGDCTYVLTAQHCVNSDGVISNSGNTVVEFYNTSGTKVTAYVSDVYLYPGYNPNNQFGDIALIKLSESLTGTVTGYGINRQMGAELGAIYTRYGFGTYGTGTTGAINDVNGTMHTGQNRWEYIGDDGFLYFDFDDGTDENNTLPKYITGLYGDTITSDLGVGAKETNSCQGDSGGPCFITVNGEAVIGGICAGGFSLECKYGDVSYDTQVAYYADWIDSIIGVVDGATSGEILVNTTTQGTQRWSDVALDADGDFVITWTSTVSESNTETDVYARRFNKDGTPVSETDFKVNTYTERQQQLSKVAIDADGDFVITWESFQEYGDGTAVGDANNYGIYMQRFASTAEATDHASLYGVNGESGTEMRVNTTVYGNQRIPNVAMTATGDIFFAWQSDETFVNSSTGSENIFTRSIYKSDDDAGPVVVRIAGEFTPTIIGVEGELIDSDRKDILDENGNPIYVNFLIEDGNTYLQNEDYYFIDRDGYFVNEAITVTKNGCIVGTNIKVDNLFMEGGKLYIQSGSKYYDLDGNELAGKQPAATLLQGGKLVDSAGNVTNISATVVIQDGKVFIMSETTRKYYDANGNEKATATVVDSLIDSAGNLLDKNGNQVIINDKPVVVSQCWVADGKAYLKNSEGYYITREGKTSASKVAAETYSSDGNLIINGKVSNITATVRCDNGKIYFEYIVKENLDRDGNELDRVGVDSLVNLSNLGNNTTVYGKINDGLYITFDEQLWGQKNGQNGGAIKERGQTSILYKGNIIIRRDGVNVTSDIVDHIELANDARGIGFDNIDPSYTGSVDNHSEKDIYKIVFRDGVSLESGNYQIIISDNVEDRFGNKLDGDADGTPGGNYDLVFTVVADLDDESSVNSEIDDSGDSGQESDNEVNSLSVATQSDPAVAMNKWGDYVVVWVSEVPVVISTSTGDDGNDSGDDNDEPTIRRSDETVIMGQRYLRDGTKVGEQFCVSNYTTTVTRDGVTKSQTLRLRGIQLDPAVAMDDEGNFVVTWTVNGRDLNEDARVSADELAEFDVFARTYNTDGEATSVPFLVDDSSVLFKKTGNTGFSKLPDYSTPGTQKDSSVAYSRADNTFVVTWSVDNSKDSGSGTYYWQNDKNGIYMARFKVADVDENTSSDNKLTYLPIYRQQTPQLVNNISTYSQITSSVAVDGEENVVVVWASDSSKGTDLDIYLKKFEVTNSSDSGEYISGYTGFNGELGTETLVNQYKHDRQETPDIAMNDNGDFVIAWSSKEKNGDYDIKFRTYDYKGNGTGAWTGEQKANSYPYFDQKSPTVAITRNVTTKSRKEPNTSFAIAWTSYGQEDQSTKDLGVYMIAYKSITDVDPETNTIRGDSNVRTKTGKEILVNVYKPQDEKNPDIAMSCYGDIVTVWDGPAIAGIDDPLNNVQTIVGLLASFYHNDPDDYADMTSAQIINLFNNTFGTSIFKSYVSSYDSNANLQQILQDDDYIPLQATGGLDNFSTSYSTGVQTPTGPRVSEDTGKTTIYTESNTASTVAVVLGDEQPSVTINGKAIELTSSDTYTFNGYLSGTAIVNVTVQGAGNEAVTIENGVLTISTGSYTFIVKNVNTVAFDSQDVSLNVNASRGETFILDGDTARLAGFTILGCTEINAIGNSSCVAKLTGTEDEEEFQVRANEVTMSGRVAASVQGFGKVTLNGAAQDEVFFTNMGDFTVNGSVITVAGVEASNFANVQVTSTGVANVTTSGAATVNVAGKTLTIAGNGFTQTYTGMSTLNLTGAANASAEVTVNSDVSVTNGTIQTAAYSVNAFGQVVVKNAANVTLNGTEGSDLLTINTTGTTFKSAGANVTFNTFNTLTLNDSEVNDSVSVLTNTSSVSIQNGVATIGNVTINGVATLAVTCTNANASANILGSAGNDVFALSEGVVSANIEGASSKVTGVSTVYIVGMGGNDTLTAADTTGNDAFTLAPSSLTARGNNYFWTVSGVENIKLYQSNGGDDTLTVTGSGAIDNAVISPLFASVTNANKATASAYGFRNLQVNNVEYVAMYDSEGDDALTIAANGQVTLESGSSFFNQVSGFKKLSIFSCGDGDDTLNAEIQAVDEIFSAPNNSWSVELNGFNF
ncbi:MAG: trypsin-like serine protease [Thermoguttaceae bacterium]|nr:trypsin-like serine protease [Thermoguttaceae bacterium]